MKSVAVVPMKLNNRRLPGKNTKCFTNGKPLCMYVLESLLQTESFSEVYVYCSTEEICKYLPNGVKFLKRPESLDQDSTKMNEVLRMFAEEVDADIYLMTHATAPFISPESLKKGLEAVQSGEYDSSFAVKKLQDFLWDESGPMNYNLDNIPRTQDLQPLYEETSGFYCYRKDIIMNHSRRIGFNPKKIVVNEIESIDIDEPLDFEIADAIFNNIISKKG